MSTQPAPTCPVLPCRWEFCTIRGCPDGELVYRFGARDPRPRLALAGAGGRLRYEPQEGVAWSNALWLWVKKGSSVELSVSKLEQYVQEMSQGQVGRCAALRPAV